MKVNWQRLLMVYAIFMQTAQAADSFNLLNANRYHHIVSSSRKQAQTLINQLQTYQDANTKVAFLAAQLADRPYLYLGAMGEGDWQPHANDYQPGAMHISQFPVYRLDGFDCQSLVQDVLALLPAQSLHQFENNLVDIAYGAAGDLRGDNIHYYNRNNFIEGDFNPVNHRNGRLVDVTAQGQFAAWAAQTHVIITRQQWFARQVANAADSIHVLSPVAGGLMRARLAKLYTHLPYPHFRREEVTLDYLPKHLFATLTPAGRYQPNQALLASLPTPAIIEVVRDVEQWTKRHQKMQALIGSALAVSHLGVIYQQTFAKGALIYQKNVCDYNFMGYKICRVTPIICPNEHCRVLMFLHATDAYPRGYFWYQQANGAQVCTRTPPPAGQTVTYCNRVERIPLFAYITDFQFGFNWYMQDKSLLGYHIERMV